MTLLRIVLAVLLPPLGVFLTTGIGATFFLNVLLTLLGYVPGMIHAVYVVAKHPTPGASARQYVRRRAA